MFAGLVGKERQGGGAQLQHAGHGGAAHLPHLHQEAKGLEQGGERAQRESLGARARLSASALLPPVPPGPILYSALNLSGPLPGSSPQELEQKGELDMGDPLNNFFKKIFAQGDEDTRRAMMKSFVESNGTVLSTNWKEVGTKPVECTPPEGMEVRKWES